jgi:hypothetical protein
VSRDLGGALAKDTEVATSTRLTDGSYLARVRGSERWVRFAEEPKVVSSKVDGEWQARVAGYEKDARSVKMQWVDDGWVKEKVGAGKFDQLVGQVRAKIEPGQELTDLMYKRDLRSAAHQISIDPVRAHAHLEAAYRSDLARADALARAGKPTEAAEHLARMERTWGATPDISTRRALAFADANDLGKAARAIERPSVGQPRSVNRVYEELARRIERSASTQHAETLRALGSANEWKAIAGGRPTLVVDGDHLTLEYHLARDAVKGEQVAVDRAVRSGAPVYVQDSPRLRNLDWSTDVERTMRQAVDGDLATVVRLPRTDVAHFRPAKIYAPDDTAVMTKVKSSNSAGQAGRNGYRAFESSGCSSANPTRMSTRGDCPEDRQAVYLIVPKGSERSYE